MTEEPADRAFRLEWCIPKDLISRYATNFIVQHTQNEFILSFFEVLPPLLLGSPEEVEAQADQIETIDAHCVARVILTPDRLEQLLRVLQINLQAYRDHYAVEENSDGNDGSVT